MLFNVLLNLGVVVLLMACWTEDLEIAYVLLALGHPLIHSVVRVRLSNLTYLVCHHRTKCKKLSSVWLWFLMLGHVECMLC